MRGIFIFLTFALFFNISVCDSVDSWVELPTKCETCKFVVTELLSRLDETGRTSEILLTGDTRNILENRNKKVKKKKYRHSELRFVETLEDLCDRLLNYNIHKEHKDSRRFAKGRSQTMQTLHGLVEKGVKVELGIPYELWDQPSVEVTQMKAECEQMIEEYEDDLQNWYFYEDDDPRREPLVKFLCEDRALKGTDQTCLKEDVAKEIELKNLKGDRGEL